MSEQRTEADVLEDPEGAVRAIRRANLRREDAERRVEQFENIFAAFDTLRRNGYAPAEYSPQWRARAETAEHRLAEISNAIRAIATSARHARECKPWRAEQWPDDPEVCRCWKRDALAAVGLDIAALDAAGGQNDA